MSRPQQSYLFEGRRLCWFSCGAASAVAAKLTLERGPAEIVYCNTLQSEHPDNARFLADVERWLGVKVQIISSAKYQTIDEVFERERFMSGVGGAKCTTRVEEEAQV